MYLKEGPLFDNSGWNFFLLQQHFHECGTWIVNFEWNNRTYIWVLMEDTPKWGSLTLIKVREFVYIYKGTFNFYMECDNAIRVNFVGCYPLSWGRGGTVGFHNYLYLYCFISTWSTPQKHSLYVVQNILHFFRLLRQAFCHFSQETELKIYCN